MQKFTPSAVYYHRSSKNPNYYYSVTRDALGHLDCDCPDRVYRGNKFCKHVKAVIRGEVRPAMVKARAETTPAPFSVDDLYSDGGAAAARSVASMRQAVAS